MAGEFTITLPEQFRLAGLLQDFDGRWKCYLQEWGTSGQLLGFHGKTPQEAIDITASALRARLAAVTTSSPKAPVLNLKLDLSNLTRREENGSEGD